MKPEWWPGEEHEAFTEWAFENGVKTDAVTPARLQGRGLGMVATRNIKVRDENVAALMHTNHVTSRKEMLSSEFQQQSW